MTSVVSVASMTDLASLVGMAGVGSAAVVGSVVHLSPFFIPEFHKSWKSIFMLSVQIVTS